MFRLPAKIDLETHLVSNQPVFSMDWDMWMSDLPLRYLTNAFGCQMAALSSYEAALGQADMRAAGRLANERGPPTGSVRPRRQTDGSGQVSPRLS